MWLISLSDLTLISKPLALQIFVFGCVGVVATLVHYSVAIFVTEILLQSVYFANFVGYCCAVSVSLFGHSRFTYRQKLDTGIARRFIVVSLSTLVASEVILYFLKFMLDMNHRIALAIVALAIPVVTFILNKFWVYATVHQK